MEEHMGRRTVGGLILTRAGSILIYRDEKETPSNSNKRNQDPTKKCKHVHSPQKRHSESSKRSNSSSNAETRGNNVNLAAKINKRVSSLTRTVSQIQGSLRGRNGNSRSGSGSSSSAVRKRPEESLGGNGDEILSGQERSSRLHGSGFHSNDRRVSPYYGQRGINSSHTSIEDDMAYWNFNIDDTSEVSLYFCSEFIVFPCQNF
jgi:hypothetical protein